MCIFVNFGLSFVVADVRASETRGEFQHYPTYQSDNEPIMSINKSLLDYGFALSTLTFTITNTGAVILDWIANDDPDESWIAINGPTGGSLECNQTAEIRVDVSRAQLPAGPSYGQILIQSNGGNAVIGIVVEVGPYPTQPILYVYPQAIDFNISMEQRSFSIKNRGAGVLTWTATELGDVDWLTSIEPSSGELSSMAEAIIIVLIDRSLAPDSFNTGIIEILSDYGVDYVSVELINGEPPHEIRANVGGSAYTAVNGDVFLADRPYMTGAWGYVGGHPFETTQSISNTEDDILYQSELFWIDGYKFDLPNGNYTVTLHFAELYYFYIGGRIFDVLIENICLLEKLDIYAEAGLNAALSYTFNHIAIADGRLDIDFRHWMAHAKLSAVEIITESTISPQLSVTPMKLDFGTTVNDMTFIIQNIGTDVLDWSISKDLAESWITSINPTNGNLISGDQQSVTITIDRNGLSSGGYQENITVLSNGGYASVDLQMTVETPLQYIKRVNCGSDEDYLDQRGLIWNADKPYFSGSWGYIHGNTYQTIDPIADTDNDKLYQSERWDMSEYCFDVSNGFYELTLHFAEIYFKAPRLRVFQVDVEGDRFLSMFDIYKEAGHDRALIKTSIIKVTDSQLNIYFTPGIEFPKISAIEIKSIAEEPLLSVSATTLNFGHEANTMSFSVQNRGLSNLFWEIGDRPHELWMKSIIPDQGELEAGESCDVLISIDRANIEPGTHEGSILIESNGGMALVQIMFVIEASTDYIQRVNCGSDRGYADVNGDFWSPDHAYFAGDWGHVGGSTYNTSDPINDTFDDFLYQSERWDLQGYKFDLENGYYEIQLLFAEIYFKKIGERSFNVKIEDLQVLTNYDIYRLFGHDRAVIETFTTEVIDKQLNIDFVQSVEFPKISAIQVKSISAEPKLVITPSVLDFGSYGTSMSFTLKNDGGGQLTWGLSGIYIPSWISSIAPHDGILDKNASEIVTITIDREGLQPGEYHDSIDIVSNGGDGKVAIQMRVNEPESYVQRVNCGGVAYTATTGEAWSADRSYRTGEWGFVGGHIYISGDPIALTLEDKLYQSERWGMQSYKFDVDDGIYDVTLLFAEIYFYSSGKRVFHVDIEGQPVLRDFDIYHEAGHDRAVSKSYRVNIYDSQLNIDFIPSIEDPKIAGIEIRKIESGNIAYDDGKACVENAGFKMPTSSKLYQNYPNPFNPSTTISFDLSEEAFIKIDVYNSIGQHITNLSNGKMPGGSYSMVWNVKEDFADSPSSGIYFCVLQIIDTRGSSRFVRRMTLSK